MQALFDKLISRKQTSNKNQDKYIFDGEKDVFKVNFASTNTLPYIEKLLAWKEKKSQKPKLHEIYPHLLQFCKKKSDCAKSVCAKIITKGQTIAQCYTCATDRSCIICMDCFKHGNHQGHKVVFKKAYGGCCDCGDSEAWKPQGFCKFHSGKEVQIQIQEKVKDKFLADMQDLFYLYYRSRLNKKDILPDSKFIFQEIIKFVSYLLDQGGLTAIKLLSLLFQSSIQHRISPALHQIPILGQMLDFSVSRGDMRQWQDVFMRMFPSYQFKKQLIAAYFKYYSQMYSSQEGQQYGQSLSCQILTSYKLVQDYISQAGAVPLGHKVDPQTPQFQLLNNIMYYDLDRISSLQGDVPYKYWRFHISHGIANIFVMHQHLKREYLQQKQQNKLIIKQNRRRNAQSKQQNETFSSVHFAIAYNKNFQNQFTAICTIHSMLRIVKHDKDIIVQVMRQLRALINSDNISILGFRPYHRAFLLALFFWIDQDPSQLLDKQKVQCLIQKLGMNGFSWLQFLNDFTHKMLQTFMFFSHTISNDSKGYQSSFYPYIYFYRLKDRFVASVDLVGIKMLTLLRSVTVQDPLEMNLSKMVDFGMFEVQSWNWRLLKMLFQEINLLYMGKMGQIFLSYYDLQQKGKYLYTDQVKSYLCKFITSQGGSVTLERVKQFSNGFLFVHDEALKHYLMQVCTYDKKRRVFELSQQFTDKNGFNYLDFSMRADKLENKTKEQTHPSRSVQLVKHYNLIVLKQLWNFVNLQQIGKAIIQVYEELLNSNIKQNLIEFIAVVGKFFLILKKTYLQEHEEFVEQLLVRMALSSEIRDQLKDYSDLWGKTQDNRQKQQRQLIEKREMLRQKKMNKLQALKMQNEANLSKIKNQHKMQQQEATSQQATCVICHNSQSNRQLVMLAKMNIRDMQAMMQNGNSIKTLSFTSCYHTFDYSCILKSALTNANNQVFFKCPLCRQAGNVFVPLQSLQNLQKTQPLVQSCVQRIMQVAMTLRSFVQIDINQQIIKAFYHYVRLGQFQPQYLINRRKKLYQCIVDLLSHPCLREKMIDCAKDLLKCKINLCPVIQGAKQKNINIYGENDEQEMFEEIDSSDEEAYEGLMQHFLARHTKKPTQKKKKKKKQEKQEKEQGYNKIKKSTFHYVVSQVILHILKKGQKLWELWHQKNKPQSLEKEKQEPNQEKAKTKCQEKQPIQAQKNIEKMEQQLKQMDNSGIQTPQKNPINPSSLLLHWSPKQLQLQLQQQANSLHQAVEPQVYNIMQQLLLNAPHSQSKPLRLRILQLPSIYHFQMNKNICMQCNQLISDVFICLLCKWTGCLNCQGGGTNQHIKRSHGQNTALLRLKDAIVYIVGMGQVRKVGCLYLNEWGEQFNQKKQWSHYSLQTQVYDKISQMLLRDE